MPSVHWWLQWWGLRCLEHSVRVYGGERNGRNATAICYVWVWSPNTYSYLSCRARVTQAIQTDLLVHVYHRQYVIMLECLLLSMYRTCGAMHCLWSQALFASCYKMLMCCLVKERVWIWCCEKAIDYGGRSPPATHGGLDRCAVWAGSVCCVGWIGVQCAVCVYLLWFFNSVPMMCKVLWYDYLSSIHSSLSHVCNDYICCSPKSCILLKYACTLVYWLQSCLNICMPTNCVWICMCCNHTYITVYTATMFNFPLLRTIIFNIIVVTTLVGNT